MDKGISKKHNAEYSEKSNFDSSSQNSLLKSHSNSNLSGGLPSQTNMLLMLHERSQKNLLSESLSEKSNDTLYPQDKPSYCVSVTFSQGRCLTSRDNFGKGDPYCLLKIGDQSAQTKHRRNTNKPIQNEKLNITCTDKKPNTIQIDCMDYDKTSKDDLIGSATIDISNYWKEDESVGVKQFYQQEIHTKKGKEGEIQIQITCQKLTDRRKLEFFQYSHLLHLIIEEVKQKEGIVECSRDTNTQIVMQQGDHSFASNNRKGVNPTFAESAFLFIDAQRSQRFKIKFSLLRHDPSYNTNKAKKAWCYVDAESLLKKNKTIDFFPVYDFQFDKDTNLNDLSKLNISNRRSIGKLKISVNLTNRSKLEEDVYSAILKEFDTDSNGVLCRDEIYEMLTAVSSDFEMSMKDFDKWFDSIDQNKDGSIDCEELKRYMGSVEFQSSALMNFVIGNYTLKDKSAAVTSKLMQGFSYSTTTESKSLRVKERETGLLVDENIPTYISIALKAMFSNKVGRVFSGKSKKLLKKLSVRQGKKYDDPQSSSQINSFIELHNLDTSILAKNLSEFRTFNDFFARSLKSDARPVDGVQDPGICVSPADCRMMVFKTIYDATEVQIKGHKFTIENLLNGDAKLAERYLGGSMAICRLAPQDYHRQHVPVSGILGDIVPIKGALYTVNPIAINSNVNVYTENKRCIIPIKTERFGQILLIAVAATMVGSYKVFGKPGDFVRKGDVNGEFRFGGSTVIILFESMCFDSDLLKNSAVPIETLVKANSRIGCYVNK